MKIASRFQFFVIELMFLCLLFSDESHAQHVVNIPIDISRKAQTIQNFGASGCWFSDPVGLHWPDSTKSAMAELLFSTATDKQGNLKGIGLSAWRFNIGAGTAEQGDSSGIKVYTRRVECFLNADGSYNWNKEAGYVWFTKKARDYGVKNLIAFVNSPPVYYTQNRLGFKTTNDVHTNLKPDKYDAYANFLATVISHFDKENIHFNFISPVNEPQWDWYHQFGEGSQEGSPYTNEEIYHVIKTLDNTLNQQGLSTRILMPEAGKLDYLFSSQEKSETGNEIQNFWNKRSPLYLGQLKHLSNFVAGHGYFTDVKLTNTIDVRGRLSDTARKYGVEYWQSEYSMLGDGFKEGSKDNRSAFDCALFLAKLIHHDLTDGNCSAWQFWNSWEPGPSDFNTRYYLLALKPSVDFKSGSFTVTKNLWALGHFSRFIRPGMVRILLPKTGDEDVLISAYYGMGKLVIVAINNSSELKHIHLDISPEKFYKRYLSYLTTAAQTDNMKPSSGSDSTGQAELMPRSITTFVINEK